MHRANLFPLDGQRVRDKSGLLLLLLVRLVRLHGLGGLSGGRGVRVAGWLARRVSVLAGAAATAQSAHDVDENLNIHLVGDFARARQSYLEHFVSSCRVTSRSRFRVGRALAEQACNYAIRVGRERSVSHRGKWTQSRLLVALQVVVAQNFVLNYSIGRSPTLTRRAGRTSCSAARCPARAPV